MAAVIADVDNVKVVPKKINWDLKRDCAKRLAKLARQTQRSVLELAVQERKRRREEEDADGDSSSESGGSESGSDDSSSGGESED